MGPLLQSFGFYILSVTTKAFHRLPLQAASRLSHAESMDVRGTGATRMVEVWRI